jgi:hypothetical protein
MLVYPFFSPKSQGTERVQRPDVVDEMSGETGSSCVSARCSPLRFCRRICLEATTVEIETLTPRLVSTVARFLSG